jgi:hypothetical protein
MESELPFACVMSSIDFATKDFYLHKLNVKASGV